MGHFTFSSPIIYTHRQLGQGQRQRKWEGVSRKMCLCNNQRRSEKQSAHNNTPPTTTTITTTITNQGGEEESRRRVWWHNTSSQPWRLWHNTKVKRLRACTLFFPFLCWREMRAKKYVEEQWNFCSGKRLIVGGVCGSPWYFWYLTMHKRNPHFCWIVPKHSNLCWNPHSQWEGMPVKFLRAKTSYPPFSSVTLKETNNKADDICKR